VSLLLSVALPSFADSIALKNGETVQGEIISETDSQVVIEVSNYKRTITSKQIIQKSDIKAVDRESDQQKQERQAYEALVDSWKLDPNNEFTKAKYEQAVKAFNEYVATYPKSRFANDAQGIVTVLTNELGHIQRGEAKFNNEWMTPNKKRLLVASILRQRVSDLQKQHDEALKAISDTETAIRQAQHTIGQGPVLVMGHYADLGYNGVNILRAYIPIHYDDSAVNKAKQDLAANQFQLDKLNGSLRFIENQIDVTRRQLAEAGEAHK
jgi:hypothetical protein